MKLLIKYLFLELPRIILLFFIVVILMSGEIGPTCAVLMEYYTSKYNETSIIILAFVALFGIILKLISLLVYSGGINSLIEDDTKSK